MLNSIKKARKTNSGITLIALVITIIVILILAGVTIATLTGDNGLLQKTTTAKQENEKAKELELIKLAVGAAKIAGEGTITKDNLENELKINFNDNTITIGEIEDGWSYNSYKIDKSGEVDKLLPKEYQQVEYIESSGTQYIDTKITIQSGLTMECDIAQIGEPFVNSVYYNPSDSIYYVGWNQNNGLLYYIYKDNTRQSTNLSLEKNKIYHIKTILKNGFQSMEVDGKVLKSTTISGEIVVDDKNLLLFGGYDINNVVPCKMILCNTKYFDNKDRSIRDFIPCYSTKTVIDIDGEERSAGTIGMYDTVEGQFYVNKGTGTFGYETLDGTYVAPKNN